MKLSEDVLQAKEVLNTGIKKFIKEKIFKASQAIAMYAQQVIKDGEIIIVYGLWVSCTGLFK